MHKVRANRRPFMKLDACSVECKETHGMNDIKFTNAQQAKDKKYGRSMVQTVNRWASNCGVPGSVLTTGRQCGNIPVYPVSNSVLPL